MMNYVLNNSEMSLDIADSWGFTAMTYAIKNNFFVGVVYLLAKGASLTNSHRDVNLCSYVHWAAFMDRASILGILFRADLDFLSYDKTEKTPWDRAIDNWSLFAIHFMLDYSQRPLKTLWFLKGNTNCPEIDLLPNKPKKSFYEVESKHIPNKMRKQTRIRQGVHKNLSSLYEHSKGYFLPEYVQYNWYKYNIQNKYWLKTYILIVICLAAHFLTALMPEPKSNQPYPALFALFVVFMSAICLFKMIRFGNFSITRHGQQHASIIWQAAG